MAQESAPEVSRSEQGPTAEPERPLANSRRGLLVGAGVLGLTGVAAACGGDDGGDTAAEPEGDTGTQGGGGGGGGGGGTALTKTGQIPVGSGKIFKGKKVVVTQPTKGEFKAFDIECTHRGCPVDKIQGDTIMCPCHGSAFSIADGSVKSGPAKEPLAAKQINIDGNQIRLV